MTLIDIAAICGLSVLYASSGFDEADKSDEGSSLENNNNKQCNTTRASHKSQRHADAAGDIRPGHVVIEEFSNLMSRGETLLLSTSSTSTLVRDCEKKKEEGIG